jgi:hypothetical protein
MNLQQVQHHDQQRPSTTSTRAASMPLKGSFSVAHSRVPDTCNTGSPHVSVN